MTKEIKDLTASKFLSRFMQRSFLYDGLYQIKKSELRVYLEKLKTSGNVEELVKILNNTLKEYDKLPKLQKELLNIFFDKEVKSLKSSLKFIDTYGEPFLNFAKQHLEKLNYENLLEFEKINYLIFLFAEIDNYLFNALKYILERKPHLLKDRRINLKPKDYEFYFKDKEDNYIYSFLAEKVIAHKLYNDYLEIFKYVNKKLGLKHNINDKDIRLLDTVSKIRDLYAHSDGKITNFFLNKVQLISPEFFDYITRNYKIGEKYTISNELILSLRDFVFGILKELDNVLIKAHPELIELEFKKRSS